MVVTEIPFNLRGTRGLARVQYGINDDPRRWGYDLLGLSFDTQHACGCPVVEAMVEHSAEGYAGELGWVQVIRYAAPGREDVEIVDTPPQLADAGIPWAAWGLRPVLFDAPSTDYETFWFRAMAFLAVSPDAVMSPVVEPLCGFRWGYNVDEGVPAPVPLAVADSSDWNDARPLLAQHCPGWRFLPATVFA
ncbi:MAG TPA: hypothetical protein VGI67_14240 [Thermoleophilaceae bacterium]